MNECDYQCFACMISHVCCHNQEKMLNFDDLFLPQPPVVVSAAAVINSSMYIYLSATEFVDLKQINCFTRRSCDVNRVQYRVKLHTSVL